MQMEPHSGVPEIAMMADARGFRAFVAVAAVIFAVMAVFWQTSASMIATWARSDTFAHGFMVVPASLWFVWARRARLAATAVRPWRPGLILLAGAGFAWLIGELAQALAPTQWAMVSMISLAVLTLFGWAWFRVLAFPLTFLFFAVPFGEVFVPTLIDWTADFTVAALTASGVPVYREGTHFVIPSGRWSVVEACSGIRYLIASLVVGVLYSWTMYRSPLRRAAFVGASMLVPLVANWVRAYLIVMIGHLTDNRIAAGVDHLIYGWIFFGLVIALMFWIGARWREDGVPAVSASTTADASVLSGPLYPPALLMTVAVVVIAGWPVARGALLAAGDKRAIQSVAAVATVGWTETTSPASSWRPSLEGPAEIVVQSFARRGSIVTLYVAYYRDQAQGSELVNSMNRLVPEQAKDWQMIRRGRSEAAFVGTPSSVHAATIRGRGDTIRVWQWYWIDDAVVTSDARAKASLALDRLLVRSDTSAWIAVFTTSEDDASADRVLAAFIEEMGPALEVALAATAGR